LEFSLIYKPYDYQSWYTEEGVLSEVLDLKRKMAYSFMMDKQ